MTPRTGALALILGVVLVAGCADAQALPVSAYRPFSGPWRPVAVPEATPAASAAPEPFWAPMPPPGPERLTTTSAPPRIRLVAKAPAKAPPRQPSRSGRSIAGKASWYCRPGVSVCPVGFSPSGMYAAACAPLRAAMGPHWRGKTVWVNGLQLVLVDYCASKTKTIDVFWGVMSRLGGTGVLLVTVRW